MADTTPLFTPAELRQYRYKCSHKLAVSLSIGAIYLVIVTFFFFSKLLKNDIPRDQLQFHAFAAAAYLLLIILIATIIRRSQSLNFSRFLLGCVKFDNFEYMLEYVELRMPGPFPARFLKYPVHLMILGKVLKHSGKPENAGTGRRMIAAAAERDPGLEPFRDAPLADLMEYHEKTFLPAHPEMLREWHGAEKFHNLLVHYILPVVVIVVVVSFVLKKCGPSEESKKRNLPAVEEVQTGTAPGEAEKGPVSTDADVNAAAPGEAGQAVTPQPDPQTETVPPQA